MIHRKVLAGLALLGVVLCAAAAADAVPFRGAKASSPIDTPLISSKRRVPVDRKCGDIGLCRTWSD